jgi:DNA/RNA endonuclease G (NUC1)
MSRKSCLILVILLVSAFNTPADCQTIEERLDRLEAKLDSLLTLLRTRVVRVPAHETISDTLNLLYGIACTRGTVLDKEYFVINHNDDWKIPYWVAYYLSISTFVEHESADPQAEQIHLEEPRGASPRFSDGRR